MFNAVRNNQKLAFFNPHNAVPKFHSESAFHHQEQFVFDFVMMPHERPGELYQFDMLAVEFPHHSGLEVIGKKRELLL